MSRWDHEAAAAAGYPEEFMIWYGDYVRQLGDNAEDIGVAHRIWKDIRPEPTDYVLPEGTRVDSRDAGANAENIMLAREIPDVTVRLDELMADMERKHGHELDNDNSYYKKLGRFIGLVDDNREYDLKRQQNWKADKYIYNGEVVKNDVPGNIGFGYLGRVFGYPEWFLTKGAGVYQILTDLGNPDKSIEDIVRQFNLDSFGDHSRDTARIKQGIRLYDRKHEDDPRTSLPTLRDLLRAAGHY